MLSGPDRKTDSGRRQDAGPHAIAFVAERLAWIVAIAALTVTGFLYFSGVAGSGGS
jgi:hypothetical protein